MRTGCLPLSHQASWCFSPQEGESMKIRTHAILLYRAKATRTATEATVTDITHKGIPYWRVRFHRQPFSKQLYTCCNTRAVSIAIN